MITKKTVWGVIVTAVGWTPSVVFAEVSDKMPSIPLITILGVVIGGGLFFLARLRWWLGILLSPIPLLLIAESISYWNEAAVRDALLNEQGWLYFGVVGLQVFLLSGGTIAGIVVGYRRRNRSPRRMR